MRFRFGQGLVKARKESENTSRFVAQQIAIAYAEDTWQGVQNTLKERIAEDVRVELNNLNRLFRDHIIGAAGTRTSPAGRLTTVTKGSDRPSASIASMLPAWAPRGAEYLDRKKKALGDTRWFDNSGWTRRPAPADGGLLRSSFPVSAGFGRGSDVWENMFGPIGVRVVRRNAEADASLKAATSRGKTTRIQVASIYVTALGKIDLNMLNAYRNDNDNDGLMRVVAETDRALAVRLAGRGPYRPTLEPFLDFFLTRALPHAVNERIKKGDFGSTFRTSSRR